MEDSYDIDPDNPDDEEYYVDRGDYLLAELPAELHETINEYLRNKYEQRQYTETYR
jgi:hypothetical protein